MTDLKPHYHVARFGWQNEKPDGYPDRCQECGRDIRDDIHRREPMKEFIVRPVSGQEG